MTNVSGALETLGKGLFAMGQTQIRKEEDEIAFMRHQALQELGIQAQKDLQANSQAFQSKENAAGREHDQAMFGQQAAASMGQLYASDELAGKREGQRQSFELRMQSRREGFALKQKEVQNLDDLKALMSSTMRSLDSDLKEANRAKLAYEGSGNPQTGEIDPAILARYDADVQALQQEKSQLRASFQSSLAAYSGIKPEPPPEAPAGSEDRTRAVSRTPSKVGLAEAQAEGKRVSATGRKAPTTPSQPPSAPTDLYDVGAPPPASAPISTARPLSAVNSDPKNVATFMQQVEALKAAGKGKAEIQALLGQSYSPEVFKTYLGW